MLRVFRGEPTSLGRILGPIERRTYRLAGIDPAAEQGWLGYALALIAFNGAGVGALYALQRLRRSVAPALPQKGSIAANKAALCASRRCPHPNQIELAL
jgi:K+-transporting ATPase ATPase A chain